MVHPVESGDRGPNRKRTVANALLGEEKATVVSEFVRDIRASRGGVGLWWQRNITAAGRLNSSRIRRFRDAYAGQRCVIIGNGPSLKDTDLDLLRNEFTFGLNRIYLLFAELGWETTFHVVVNQLVVEQCAEDFKRIRVPLFTTMPNLTFLRGAQNAVYLNTFNRPRFFTDVNHGIWEGATVTYVAMQLAYYMGFTEVVLVGVDHRFAVTGPASQVVESTGPDGSHFDPNYFGKGFRWQLPDLETSEIAYTMARRQFESQGRRIVDATVGGALTVFPKVPIAEALAK